MSHACNASNAPPASLIRAIEAMTRIRLLLPGDTFYRENIPEAQTEDARTENAPSDDGSAAVYRLVVGAKRAVGGMVSTVVSLERWVPLLGEAVEVVRSGN